MDFIAKLKKTTSNVLHKNEDIYVYAYDTSQNPEKIILPLAVVFPKNTTEVSSIVKLCNENNISIVPRAQGTNHCGGTRPVENCIIMHFSKMNKIIEINKENLTAIVEPNVVIGDLNKELDKLNLFFPPDPSNLAVSMPSLVLWCRSVTSFSACSKAIIICSFASSIKYSLTAFKIISVLVPVIAI